MSAYVVVNAKIADIEKYRANFQKAAQALHDRLGAKMLARTDQPVTIAGNTTAAAWYCWNLPTPLKRENGGPRWKKKCRTKTTCPIITS